MTREEAKSNIRTLLEIGGSDGFDYKEREALDMAIEALEQEPCGDAISRDMALEKMADYAASGYADSAEDFEEYSRIICQLPPVDPVEKVGHWVTTITPLGKCCICSKCRSCPPIEYRFCPYCGAKMQDVQEANK